MTKIQYNLTCPACEKQAQEVTHLGDGVYECDNCAVWQCECGVGERIGLLRQWLNEERITDPKKMVTNEELEYWLKED